MKEETLKKVKTAVRFAVIGLSEIFMGAVIDNVVGSVDGSKLAKTGAKAGGFLVGLYIGSQVSDRICDGIEYATAALDDIKESIDEEE